MKKILCFFVIFFILFCNTAKSQDEELLKVGIKFVPPVNWTKQEKHVVDKDIVTDATFYFSPDKNAYISLMHSQISFAMFEDSMKIWSEQRKPPEKINFLNVPCYIFSFEMDGGKRKTKQYNFFKNNQSYMIAFTANESEYNDYLPEFEKALVSFNLSE